MNWKNWLGLIIAGYLLLINLITFIVFGLDKRKAKKGVWRIPEKKLLLLAVIGGSAGAMTGMKCFHHKTMKKKFSVGIPLILILQLILMIGLLYFGYAGRG